MCGIFGYIGHQQALPILVEGLRRLEYRGYDSTGVAVDDGSQVQTHKTVGKVADLKAILPKSVSGTRGIAHTRWATHGASRRPTPTHMFRPMAPFTWSTTASSRTTNTFAVDFPHGVLSASVKQIQKFSFK